MKIHEIINRLRRMNLAEGNRFLEGLIRMEKPRSVWRSELESLLCARKTKELKRENRAA